MSGAEVITTVQLIDACVGITRTIVEIGEAARDAKGLPGRLKELFERLPVIEHLLVLARENYDNVSNEDRMRVEPVLRRCKESLEELKAVFRKACPQDGEDYSKRVRRGTESVFFGREGKVLRLLDTILGNLRLLEQIKVYDIGDRLESLSETIRTLAEDDTPVANNTHTGSGNQNILQGSGNMYNQGGGYHSTFHQPFASPLTNTNDLCLQSLAFPDMETRGDIDPKIDQTCEWISRHAKYLQWNREGGLLWIKGRPGTGKSTLMESLRKASLQDFKNTAEGENLVLSFFFHRRGHELQKTPLGLFRSILHQILRCDRELLLHFVRETRFEARYQAEGEPGKGRNWDWSAPDLQELLTDFVLRATKARRLRLYIDALDESGEKAGRGLMEYLGRLYTGAGSHLEICISCRPWPNVIHGWHYCIDVVEENAQDIKQLLRKRLSKWSVSSAEIEDEIASRASGVFQWAVIVVERVLSLRDAGTATILAHIRNVPVDLDDLYQEIFSELKGDDRKSAIRLFRWVTFAKRPLSLTEIRYAVAIEANSELRSSEDCNTSAHWCDNDEQMHEKLRRVSCGLIRILELNGIATVQFDHESVQDYMLSRGLSFLENTNWNGPDVHMCERSESILSSVCFRYLVCPDVLEASRQVLAETLPLAEFATVYCWAHASDAEVEGHSVENITKITMWPKGEIAFVQRAWLAVAHLERYSLMERLKLYPFTGRSVTLQHFAAYYGLSSVTDYLIPRMSRDRRLINLLRKRSDGIDVRDMEGRTPLLFAAALGHVSVVQLLLSTNRVDVNAKSHDGQTPICVAARYGNDSVVLLLLGNKKVNVEAKDQRGYTPLSAAASCGRISTVQLLIVTGKVNIETRDKRGRNALAIAATRGYTDIAETLLKNGVKFDVDVKDEHGRPTLGSAAYNGHTGVVVLILDHGKLDIEAKDEDGRTPLAIAANRGDTWIFQRILQIEMVDVNARDNDGKTPLAIAARGYNELIVQLLLQNEEVDVNTRDNNGRTPLAIAVLKNKESIVQLLLQTEKVDVEARDSAGNTPFSMAAMENHVNIMKLLLADERVGVNPLNDVQRTPFHIAACCGSAEAVEMLLGIQVGSINARDKFGETPLGTAAAHGFLDVVSLLLEHGSVDINATPSTGIGHTSLWLAAHNGHEEVVKALLRTGKADTNARGLHWRSGWVTSLEIAEAQGHREVANVLRNHLLQRAGL